MLFAVVSRIQYTDTGRNRSIVTAADFVSFRYITTNTLIRLQVDCLQFSDQGQCLRCLKRLQYGEEPHVTRQCEDPDPLTKLTAAEKVLVDHINATWSRRTAITRLKADLQTAVEIELATIPIYLFTYYSLERTSMTGNNIRPMDLYANKAAGVIMSVAVEEMLHMSLSSNILYALGQAPKLYNKAPQRYPTGLPYHNPKGPPGPDAATTVKIPLSRLTYEQLWHFLQVEYPETFDAAPQDRDWDSIGQFYSYIRCLICSKWITDADFQAGEAERQIQHFNYSPNNIDTIYPDQQFDPWKPASPANDPAWARHNTAPKASSAAVYPNAEDSFAAVQGDIEATPLISVANKIQAMTAIDTICDQGEGFAPQGGGGEDEQKDDQSGKEESHYFKFLSLQAQFARYTDHIEKLATFPQPPQQLQPPITQDDLDVVLINFPDNPKTADYTDPKHIALSNFCNGLFSYMFIMTETMYRLPPDPEIQRRFFNEGLHRSMIWVLDKLILDMRTHKLKNNSPVTQYLAPTFENYDLGTPCQAFGNLIALGNEVIRQCGADSSAASIVATAISATDKGRDGTVYPMHLPDVSVYWQ